MAGRKQKQAIKIVKSIVQSEQAQKAFLIELQTIVECVRTCKFSTFILVLVHASGWYRYSNIFANTTLTVVPRSSSPELGVLLEYSPTQSYAAMLCRVSCFFCMSNKKSGKSFTV